MNTKWLMASSAAFMFIIGSLLSFMPMEILSYAGLGRNMFIEVIIQAAGGIYLGFAMLNWMAKDNLMGGIYSKPLSLGNFVHFSVAAIVLSKRYAADSSIKIILIAAIIYCIFAVLFGVVTFGYATKK